MKTPENPSIEIEVVEDEKHQEDGVDPFIPATQDIEGSIERTYRVLIVEDDEQLREMLIMVFTNENFEVSSAADGRAAWWMIREDRPDVVVCDFLMPYMDGGKLLAKIRSHERFRDLPFVMMSATGDANTLVKMLDDGADDYLVKPMHTPELLARVRRILRAKSMHASLQGDLQNLALVDLLQLLKQNQRSGCLELARGNESYFFYFHGGDLVQLESSPKKITGTKALFRVLAEDDGDFRFHTERTGEDKEKDPSLEQLDFLLMDAFRYRDEINVLWDAFPSRKVLFQLNPTRSTGELTAQQFQILQLLKNPKHWYSVGALLDGLPEFTDKDILESLGQLVQSEHLVQVTEDQHTSESREMGVPARANPSEKPVPSGLLGSPTFAMLRDALLHTDANAAFSAIEGSLQAGIQPETLYQKIIVGALIEVLEMEERGLLKLPLRLPELQHILDSILNRLWPLFSLRPPIHNSVVIGTPVGESGSLQMLRSFLRAVGFGVVDLGVQVNPVRFVETTMSSGASLVCLMTRTESGAQSVGHIRALFDRRGLHKIPILVAGPYFTLFPAMAAQVGASGIAQDALDVARQARRLLLLDAPPINPS